MGCEPACRPRKVAYVAGWSKDAVRVIEPRNIYRRGQKDNFIRSRKESRRFRYDSVEGSSPECIKVSIEDTTGVLEPGMYAKG